MSGELQQLIVFYLIQILSIFDPSVSLFIYSLN